MAIRRPLKFDGSNLVEMSASDISNMKAEIIRQYGLNPSVTLSVGTGNMTDMIDTRLQAGAYSTAGSSYPSESVTEEPSTITVTYNKIIEKYNSVSAPTYFPVYFSGGDIKPMSITDMRDTFIDDVINTLTSPATTTNQAGTYTIDTSTSLAGATLVSSTPVFSNTSADTSLYTASGIPEAQDQPMTIQNYYLHKIDPAPEGSWVSPMFIALGNNLRINSRTAFQSMIGNLVRYYASQVSGYKIDYSISTIATNSRGSAMVDSKLTGGSGNYTTLLAGANDYRAQEFPDGTLTTQNTYYLNCQRI